VLAAARARADGPPTTQMSRIAIAPTEEDVPRPRPVVAAAPPEPPRRPQSPAPVAAGAKPKRFTWRVAGFVVLLVAVVVGTFAAIGVYARSTYYVGFAGDQVAIYKGRPDGVLWFKPTLRERKPLTRAEVPAIYLADVEKGKQVDSKAAADRYVTNLRDKHLEEEKAGLTTSTTTPPTTVPPPPLPAPDPPS